TRNQKEVPNLKMKHLRDDVAAGRRRLYIRAICPSLREAPLLYSYPL
ncbi:lysis system i-spanin subunit Rz, partial [Escherichia coli]